MAHWYLGPTIGGPFPAGENVPRAVSSTYFRDACPAPTVARSDEDWDYSVFADDAAALMDKWVQKLNSMDRCVEMDSSSPVLFNEL